MGGSAAEEFWGSADAVTYEPLPATSSSAGTNVTPMRQIVAAHLPTVSMRRGGHLSVVEVQPVRTSLADAALYVLATLAIVPIALISQPSTTRTDPRVALALGLAFIVAEALCAATTWSVRSHGGTLVGRWLAAAIARWAIALGVASLCFALMPVTHGLAASSAVIAIVGGTLLGADASVRRRLGQRLSEPREAPSVVAQLMAQRTGRATLVEGYLGAGLIVAGAMLAALV